MFKKYESLFDYPINYPIEFLSYLSCKKVQNYLNIVLNSKKYYNGFGIMNEFICLPTFRISIFV